MAMNPFKIHTATNINAMAISTDLRTFYLIDNGKAIDFPLDTPSGLVIGEVFGKLTFAAQVRVNKAADGEDSSGLRVFKRPGESLAAAEEPVVLPLENSTWSTQFIPQKKVIAIIGASDIVIAVQGDTKEPNPQIFLIPTVNNIIKINNREGKLTITSEQKILLENQAV